MTPTFYWIEFKTGKITKGARPSHHDGLETFGYRCAQAVARLCKKGEMEAALHAANNGIEIACRK